MNKTTDRWIKALASDVIVFGAAWLGIVEGHDWALNVFLFVAWAYAILFALAGTIGEKLAKDETLRPRTAAFKRWDSATDIVLILIAAATGRFVLATAMLIGWSAKEHIYSLIEKPAKAGGAA